MNSLNRMLKVFFLTCTFILDIGVSIGADVPSTDVRDVNAVPFINAKCKEIYKEWRIAGYQRAFAISPGTGDCGIAEKEQRVEYAIETAMQQCQKNGAKCFVYAQNGDVVWKGNNPESANAPQGTTTAQPKSAEEIKVPPKLAEGLDNLQNVVGNVVQQQSAPPFSTQPQEKLQQEAVKQMDNGDGRTVDKSVQAEAKSTKFWVILYVVLIVFGALFAFNKSRRYKWDFVTLIPMFCLVYLIPVAYFAVIVESASWWQGLIGIYIIVAGSVAHIWFRHKVMDWYVSNGWLRLGTGPIDIMFKQMGQRYSTEAFIALVSVGFGFLGAFILGYLELKKESPLDEDGNQVNIV